MARRTIALAQQAKLRDPEGGYDQLLKARMRAVLAPCRARGIRMMTNMGEANPIDAAQKTRTFARNLGLAGLRIAAGRGDDLRDAVRAGDFTPEESGAPAASLGNPIVSALADGADVIITGRDGDPALFLVLLVHEFGWAMDDWKRLGHGTLVGHLLECAGQIAGGYFADPGCKDVPGLARLGFPSGIGAEDGTVEITKVDGSGGRISLATSKGADARRCARSGPLSPAGRGRRLLRGRDGADRPGSRAGDRCAGLAGDGPPEGLGRVHRLLHRGGADLLRRPQRPGPRTARLGCGASGAAT